MTNGMLKDKVLDLWGGSSMYKTLSNTGILLTMLSLHLGQFYLPLQLNTQRPGFHLVPDEWSYSNALISPA